MTEIPSLDRADTVIWQDFIAVLEKTNQLLHKNVLIIYKLYI